MKKIITIIVLTFVSVYCFSQEKFPLNIETGKVEFEEVIESPLSKDVLFNNADTWIKTAKIFDSDNLYKSEILMDNMQTGRLIANFSYKYTSSLKSTKQSLFRITIDCRDNKYRYKLDDYYSAYSISGIDIITTWQDWHNSQDSNDPKIQDNINNAYKFVQTVINSLKQGMSVNDDF